MSNLAENKAFPPTEGPARNINQTRRMEAAARHGQALALRLSGATYKDIARHFGWIGKNGLPLQGTAYNACQREMRRLVTEPAEQLRAVEELRINRAMLAIWTRVTNGDLGAIDRFIRLSERRCRLLGLDMPVKIAPTNPEGNQPYQPVVTFYLPQNFRDVPQAVEVIPQTAITDGSNGTGHKGNGNGNG
jgi:hypothetical protein